MDQIINNMETGNLAEWSLVIMAVIAAVISLIGYWGHNVKEKNKLLSQLNKRYINNSDMQIVVKYLREIDPENEEPTTYQLELFLRFFEELGVYLRNGNLSKKDANNFYNHYLERLYSTERGKKLLARINGEDKKLGYLNIYKKKVGFKY